MDEFDIDVEIEDSLVNRNYKLIGNYFMSLVDAGLDFLKIIYVEKKSETPFSEFAADNYYDYILRDYLRRQLKTQLKYILKGAAFCLQAYQDGMIDQNFLDEFVFQIFPEYSKHDLVLIYSDPSHPARQELKSLSKLALRVAIVQATHLISHNDSNISTHEELIQTSFKSIKECQKSLNALFYMSDEIIDFFEMNLDMINIPFYKPMYKIRDFSYTRKVYEFALKKAEDEMKRVYNGEENL